MCILLFFSSSDVSFFYLVDLFIHSFTPTCVFDYFLNNFLARKVIHVTAIEFDIKNESTQSISFAEGLGLEEEVSRRTGFKRFCFDGRAC